MLERRHRLTSSAGFTTAARRGRRAGTRTLVLHVAAGPGRAADTALPASPQVGFVVSRAVGDAVTRNRVKRRLRHLVRARVDAVPAGSVLVVRALPAAGTASSVALERDLDAALGRLLGRVGMSP